MVIFFVVLWLLLLINILLFFSGIYHCRKGNSFGLIRKFSFLGIFVWGDALILSLFWSVTAVICLWLQDLWLFLSIVSIFWLVRSVGETFYWFLQQFASEKRDAPESLIGYNLVKNESIWFIYQVMWQCLTVISVMSSIYCVYQWLHSLPA